MEWLLIKQEGDTSYYRCSVCNSEIEVNGDEPPCYCKHCESEVQE